MNGDLRDLLILTHSVPTRRSSDLILLAEAKASRLRFWYSTRAWASRPCSLNWSAIFAKSNFSHCSASLLGSMKAAKSNLGNSPLKKGVLETAMVWAPLPSREWPRGLNVASHKIWRDRHIRSEEHTSELQSLMRISYAV